MLHQHQVRRYQERALDTYTDEPFRAVDWQLQGMSQTGDKTYGTAEEWTLVAKRVASIPAFLKVAQEQLNAGIKAGNTPDWRMLIRNGIETSEANAKYFAETLPKLAEERVSGPHRDEMVSKSETAIRAGAAYVGLRDFSCEDLLLTTPRRKMSRVSSRNIVRIVTQWAKKNTTGPSKTICVSIKLQHSFTTKQCRSWKHSEGDDRPSPQNWTSPQLSFQQKALRLFAQSSTSFQRTIRNPTPRWSVVQRVSIQTRRLRA